MLPGAKMTPSSLADGTAVNRLELRGVSKTFEAVQALRDVSFVVEPGTIHALVGENGAGKSTLVKIVTGLERADSGHVLVDGAPRQFSTPIEARASGITAVYQDPKLFPHLDVAENIFLGIYDTTRLGTVNRRTMYRRAAELLSAVGVDLDPHAMAASLTVAELRFVEIARAMSADVRLLILDEPTAALTPTEAARLFAIARSLRDRGAAILFISHRLEEIFGLADRLTVLRDGAHVGTFAMSDMDEDRVVRLMVGRELVHESRADTPPSEASGALRVEGLSLRGVFSDISFSVRSGEIVGMAGLVGAGRSEIAQSLFGISPPDSGSVWVKGKPVRILSPDNMLRQGLAYVPEDRDVQGLVTRFSVERNISLAILRRLTRFGLMRVAQEQRIARSYADRLQIKAANLQAAVANLSGGNRQKTLLAKWLATSPAVLILDEPTHGIDVATKREVHQIIYELARTGLGIIVISSDLPEVLAVSDRILVISEGRLVKELSRAEATQESILAAAAGLSGNGR